MMAICTELFRCCVNISMESFTILPNITINHRDIHTNMSADSNFYFLSPDIINVIGHVSLDVGGFSYKWNNLLEVFLLIAAGGIGVILLLFRKRRKNKENLEGLRLEEEEKNKNEFEYYKEESSEPCPLYCCPLHDHNVCSAEDSSWKRRSSSIPSEWSCLGNQCSQIRLPTLKKRQFIHSGGTEFKSLPIFINAKKSISYMSRSKCYEDMDDILADYAHAIFSHVDPDFGDSFGMQEFVHRAREVQQLVQDVYSGSESSELIVENDINTDEEMEKSFGNWKLDKSNENDADSSDQSTPWMLCLADTSKNSDGQDVDFSSIMIKYFDANKDLWKLTHDHSKPHSSLPPSIKVLNESDEESGGNIKYPSDVTQYHLSNPPHTQLAHRSSNDSETHQASVLSDDGSEDSESHANCEQMRGKKASLLRSRTESFISDRGSLQWDNESQEDYAEESSKAAGYHAGHKLLPDVKELDLENELEPYSILFIPQPNKEKDANI